MRRGWPVAGVGRRPKRIVKVFGQPELVSGRLGECPDRRPGEVHKDHRGPYRDFRDRETSDIVVSVVAAGAAGVRGGIVPRRFRLHRFRADHDRGRGIVDQHADHGRPRPVERAHVRVQHSYVHAVDDGRTRVVRRRWRRRRFDHDYRYPPGHVGIAQAGNQSRFVIAQRRDGLQQQQQNDRNSRSMGPVCKSVLLCVI